MPGGVFLPLYQVALLRCSSEDTVGVCLKVDGCGGGGQG